MQVIHYAKYMTQLESILCKSARDQTLGQDRAMAAVENFGAAD